MIVKLQAQLLKVESRADRTYKLTFNTQELPGKEAAALLACVMDMGHLLYSPIPDMSEADIPDEKPDMMLSQKTQAQRIRAVLYKIWESRGSKGSFEDYYRTATERIIDRLKEQLE